MSNQEHLNTQIIQKFIQQVKSADGTNQKEIRIDIKSAKNLAFTLGMVMARLEGDLEKIILSKSSDKIEINIDGGNNW